MFNVVETSVVMNNKDNTEQFYDERKIATMSYYGTLSPASSVDPTELLSPIKSSLSPPHLYNHTNVMPMDQDMGMVEFMPYLEIKEQPVEKFRFRYKSEMVGTHGSLTGVNSDKIRKNTYPTVQLHNYEGTAMIRCSLVQIKSDEPHAHRLVIKEGNGEKDDPHNIEISPERGYVAVFQGMGIIHTAKKYLKSELAKKKAKLLYEEMSRKKIFGKLTTIQEADIDRQAEALSKTINLNTVRLKFEAFKFESNTLYPLCQPTYSHGINNLKSALTGELKIVRLDHTTSSCVGGQEIYLLVEKVTKNNIKVRFFECDEDDNEIWSDYGKFSHIDVHHQYAIVLKAPPYKDLNIENTVEVCIQLERPSDGARSEPRVFKYKPTVKTGRKRSRYSESLSSNELPTTINNLSLSTSFSLSASFAPQNPDFFNEITNVNSDEFERLWGSCVTDYEQLVSDSAPNHNESVKMSDPETNTMAKRVVSILQARLKSKPPPADIERLVDNLFNRCTTKQGNNNALHTSILCEQYEHLQYILVLLSKMSHMKIVDIKNYYNETALHLAIKMNKPAIVGLLLSVGADPNIIDNKGNTPLHLAVFDELNLENYEKLVQDTHINKENYDGFTPLHLAVMKNNLKSVEILVAAKANVNAKYASNGNTALHMAVEEKCLHIVRFLVQKTEARLDAENYSKTTPIHMAKLLSSDDETSEQIWLIINNYIKERGYDIGSIKSEPDDEESNSDSDEVIIKSEPTSPERMETEDLRTIKDAEFTDECICLLGKILDGTDTLQQLAHDLDFYSIATSVMTISTQRLLNYANVTGICVFTVRKLLVSYHSKDAVNIIDELYLTPKEDKHTKSCKKDN